MMLQKRITLNIPLIDYSVEVAILNCVTLIYVMYCLTTDFDMIYVDDVQGTIFTSRWFLVSPFIAFDKLTV